MTQITQNKLKEIYEKVFTCFRKGEFENIHLCSKADRLVRKQANKKLKRPFNESKSHESTIDFLLYCFCATHNLIYHKNYYKIIHAPWDSNKIKLNDIEFNDFMEFISPETKKTMQK
jgi:hypothetical protein